MSLSTEIKFKGSLAVVTGSASGIGKAIAERCCEEGINVALVDIDNDRLQKQQQELSSRYPNLMIHSFICDCTDNDAIGNKLIPSIKSKFLVNSIQLLFNNIGVISYTSVMDGDLKRLHRQMDTNVWSTIYLTQQFLPLLKASDNEKKDCFIVNTGSLASILPPNGFYGVTKNMILAISETIERELQVK